MAAKDKVVVDIITNSDKSKSSLLKYAAAAGAAAVAIGTIIKVGKQLVDAYKIQEQAEIKLTSALKATHGAVGISKDAMLSYAQEMSRATGISDENIISTQALMTTFTQIGKETFPDAINAAADMSKMFGQDLQQSAVQLGTALNDPIAGVGRLKRIGISFTESQKATIQSFMDVNDIASAQRVILDELSNEFGGVAKAAGETATAALEKMHNATGDLKEQLGRAIVDGLGPFAKATTKIVNALTDWVKKNNDVKDFLNIMESGGDTANTSIETLQATLARLESQVTDVNTADFGFEGVNQDLLDQISNIKMLIAAKQKSAGLDERYAEAQRQNNKEEEARIAAQKKANEEHIKDLEALTTAYKGTKEGQIKALEAQIAYFEEFKKGPMAVAVLQDLNDQLIQLKGTTDETIIATEDFDIAAENALKTANDQMPALIESTQTEIQAVEDLTETYKSLASDGLGAFVQAFEDVGKGDKKLWEGFKDGAKDAVAAVLKSLGQMALAKAAIALVDLNIPAAIGYTAAATGAYAAAGMVESFATGGAFTTTGSTPILVGDNASGSERVTIEPTGGDSGNQSMILSIDGQQFRGWMQQQFDNGTIRVPRRVLV